MFSFIRGIVVDTDLEGVILENNGIGYRILSSLQSIQGLVIGEQAEMHTQMIVRENDIFLVGFNTASELKLFNLLTSVSGVGTKVGLAILSSEPYTAIATAIVWGDSATLQKANGVGKKTAERIVLELQDRMKKLGGAGAMHSGASVPAKGHKSSAPSAVMEVEEALEVLGYNQREIMEALSMENWEGRSAEQILSACLRSLSKI